MDKALYLAQRIREMLLVHFDTVEISGEVRRSAETVGVIELVIGADSPVVVQNKLDTLDFLVKDPRISSPFVWRGRLPDQAVALEIVAAAPERVTETVFLGSSDPNHLGKRSTGGKTLYQIAKTEQYDSEAAIYATAGLPFIVPEMREGAGEWQWAERHSADKLVTWDDLRGILHNHSTYSDGRNTLEEMALYCRELGFEYLGMADHSQSAAYARGLKADQVMAQQEEIDRLNLRFAGENTGKPFRILKGIEADILGDGSLDYPDDVLATFDFVVASVHSNLAMSQEKAMERLLKAISNPFTTILGHPTGRLLLSRAGYPVDHRTIIDACAEHHVVIEINASPWRLDIDWRWIGYCMEKGVMLSINPDAHETAGFLDMHYGVAAARKGGLTRDLTFNALSLQAMENWLQARKSSIGKTIL